MHIVCIVSKNIASVPFVFIHTDILINNAG